jgi:hypothetical protein
MNGSLINWLVGGISTIASLLLALCLWVLKEHARSDEEQFRLIRQRLHDALNHIAEIKGVIQIRKKERKQ